MQPIQVSVGPLVAANDQAIAATQTPAGTTLTLTATPVVLDAPRQIVITSAGNDSGITFTVVGTGYSGQAQTEVIAGANASTATSVLNFATVSSITASGAIAGAVKAGTTAVAGSRWVRFDSWANAQSSVQVDVSGTVNYTVQVTMDDPNDPFSPIAPVNVTWLSSPDSNVVSQASAKYSYFAYTPTFARVLLNSGTGSATATFAQFSNAPY
jgi:hypothetical protein